ncbi:UNVERIFIED_CONTAM: hypothetical protein Sradi_3773200 [Sesamum radiatum]|uniref:Uncharacterized protein n=1 Tax=Sesamum radiatum TaxID=300843 RepID=A0AAW2PZJ5_SESRA
MFEGDRAYRLEYDNGFRTGYLGVMEQLLNRSCPNSELKAEPHISSKIHVWKNKYWCNNDMMGHSGFLVGIRPPTQSTQRMMHLRTLLSVAGMILQIDSFAKTLRFKLFPYYAQWCEVFGKDRTTGEC